MKQVGEQAQPLKVTALTCAQRLMDVTPHVMQAFREEMRNHRPAEFSVPEFRTLSYIERHRGTSLTAITDHIGLSKASLSKIVARLEQQDLIKRGAATGDKRRHTLNLTVHGQRTLDQAERATLRSIAGRLTHLQGDDLTVIARALALLETPFSSGS